MIFSARYNLPAADRSPKLERAIALDQTQTLQEHLPRIKIDVELWGRAEVEDAEYEVEMFWASSGRKIVGIRRGVTAGLWDWKLDRHSVRTGKERAYHLYLIPAQKKGVLSPSCGRFDLDVKGCWATIYIGSGRKIEPLF